MRRAASAQPGHLGARRLALALLSGRGLERGKKRQKAAAASWTEEARGGGPNLNLSLDSPPGREKAKAGKLMRFQVHRHVAERRSRTRTASWGDGDRAYSRAGSLRGGGKTAQKDNRERQGEAAKNGKEVAGQIHLPTNASCSPA
ncbi:UNVERIFIED_CONTAM: hypothetical protein HHA_453220 [Hammondia hammondi]|eukprot:XP_008886480.1 hypothetical protein HHA_453220 [Hammondia hammondi]